MEQFSFAMSADGIEDVCGFLDTSDFLHIFGLDPMDLVVDRGNLIDYLLLFVVDALFLG